MAFVGYVCRDSWVFAIFLLITQVIQHEARILLGKSLKTHDSPGMGLENELSVQSQIEVLLQLLFVYNAGVVIGIAIEKQALNAIVQFLVSAFLTRQLAKDL